MSSVSLTFYHLCRRYPGGITAVAHLMGMSADVLQKKLSPTCDTHHLMVDEAEAITQLTGDAAGAVEFARIAGLATVPMPGTGREGSLYKGMADIGREFAELLEEFSAATQDNMISPNECDRFQKEMLDVFVAMSAELGRMRAMAATRAPVVPIRESAA
jgi:hypothetical protein